MGELFAMKTPTGMLDPAKLRYPTMVQPKLDGLRGIWVNGQWRSFTGKPLWNLEHASTRLCGVAEGWVLDGEIVWPGHPFADAYGLCKRQSFKPDTAAKARELVYYVFDALKLNEWYGKTTRRTYVERHMGIVKLLEGFDLGPVRILPASECLDHGQFLNAYKHYLAAGHEGLMAKDPDGLYRWKRHKDWQRYKPVQTEDFLVVGTYEEVSIKGEPKGRLGGVDVALPDGTTTKVGGGFTASERIAYWTPNRGYLIGKVIEVEFKLRTNDGKLREPVFIRLREDKS